MTVVRMGGAAPRFTALSADVKPTTGLTIGAHLLELDTGSAFIWDGSTWRAQPASGAGATTIADGADTTQGLKADAAASDSTSSWTVVALLKGIYAKLAGTQTVGGTVGVSSLPSLPAGSAAIGSVSVSNLPATQPVSGNVGVTSLPALPTGGNVVGGVTVADGSDATQGALADALVAAGAAGSLSAKLRRLTTDLAALLAQIPATLGQKAKAASLSVTLASDQDAIGLAAGTNKVGGVTIADGDNATQGAIADAVVAAGAAGSLSAKLRRLTTDLSALLGTFLTAAAMGDSDSLTGVTTRVGAYLMGSNGANFVRARVGIYGNLTNSNSASQNAILVAAQGLLYNGANQDTARGANVFKPFTISNSNAETTIWTPTSGKKFRLMGFTLFSDIATVLTFKDGTGGTTIWKDGVAANSRANSPAIQNGILSAAANNVLTLTCATAATVNGTCWGVEE